MSVKDKAAAIDRFVRTIKASGVYDDIGTACIMAGWTNLAGALYPLKGAAPTNNGFLAADLDAGIGLKGDGSSKYLATGRGATDDPQNDFHLTVFASSKDASAFLIGARNTNATYNSIEGTGRFFNRGVGYSTNVDAVRFAGSSRTASDSLNLRIGGNDFSSSVAPLGNIDNREFWAFCLNDRGTAGSHTDATISWYSIGSATDLAALDSAVSTLMADLRAIDEAGFDRDALAYIRNVEAADGSYLETGVKQAINAFVVGCKKDGIWDALKASCIMCGARTISGALVPLAGAAPTPYNFASGDYSRTTGLKGDGSTKYLDSNRANNADGQDDNHNAFYLSVPSVTDGHNFMGSNGYGVSGANNTFGNLGVLGVANRSNTALVTASGQDAVAGFKGTARAESGSFSYRTGDLTTTSSQASFTPTSQDVFVFCRNDASVGATLFSDARLAFYSIGSALDLAALDNRVTTLIAAIAAAI